MRERGREREGLAVVSLYIKVVIGLIPRLYSAAFSLLVWMLVWMVVGEVSRLWWTSPVRPLLIRPVDERSQVRGHWWPPQWTVCFCYIYSPLPPSCPQMPPLLIHQVHAQSLFKCNCFLTWILFTYCILPEAARCVHYYSPPPALTSLSLLYFSPLCSFSSNLITKLSSIFQ